MDMSEKWLLSPKHNPAFKNDTAEYFLAYKDSKIVGRIAVIEKPRSNELWNERYARFGWIDFIDDHEVSSALMKTAEDWARQRGLTDIHGPLGFTDFDYEGMLVEGFDNPGSITTIYNYPYYPEHLEKLGYAKSFDWLQYKMKGNQPVPEKVEHIADIVSRKYKLKVIRVRSRFGFVRYAKKMFTLINRTFRFLYGFVPYTDKERDFFLSNYYFIARFDLTCFVVDELDNLVGFAVCYPSYTNAFQKSKGKLIPFGIFRLLWAKYFFKDVEMSFVGVSPEWQKRGAVALIHNELNKIFIRKKVRYAITNPQLEDNIAAVSIWQNYGSELYARRRCYSKKIVN